MVQIIAGEKGKGKTKYLLEKANTAIKESTGSIVYLDKSSKHMYELNNKIRLINVKEYPIASCEAFIGFICGIISQDYDLEMMFLDSFLKLASLEGEDISEAITTLENICNLIYKREILNNGFSAFLREVTYILISFIHTMTGISILSPFQVSAKGKR